MPFSTRTEIKGMRPYEPGKPIEEVQRELGLERVIKLASNENPLGPSPKAIAAAQSVATQLHLYPDASTFALHQAVAQRLGVSQQHLAFGNGSDELIHLLGLVFLGGAEDSIVVGDPSFVRYDAAAQIAGARVIKVPCDSQWRLDAPAMAHAIEPGTKLVFLANPNNPTGSILSSEEQELIINALPPGACLVLDEAYVEYNCEPVPSVDWVKQGRPVIVLRTMSKAYGLAGIRLGYAIAAPELIQDLERVRAPFNVNAIAQAAALAALGDDDHLRRGLELNAAGLLRLRQGALELGFESLDSQANFVCIKVGDSDSVFQGLLREGVIVRPGRFLGMSDYIRVTSGTVEENELFLAALARVASPARATQTPTGA